MQAQRVLTIWEDALRTVGLKLTVHKAKYMGIGPNIELTLEDGRIERAEGDELNILGVWISVRHTSSDEVE